MNGSHPYETRLEGFLSSIVQEVLATTLALAAILDHARDVLNILTSWAVNSRKLEKEISYATSQWPEAFIKEKARIFTSPSFPSSRSSSTRIEHGRSREEQQAASADQDSRVQARKVVQAIIVTWGPPGRYGTSGGYVRPPSYGNGLPVF
eukprot:1137939-Pelagomonas_calceolata.AAC.1